MNENDCIQFKTIAWYIDGTELSEELFKEITEGPVEDLPKYLGQGFDEYIAERLKS